MKLRPTGKRILVEPIPAAEKTEGGIVLAEHWKQPSGQARVIAAGAQVKDIQPGDRVIYSWINGRDVEHEGKTMRLLHVDEILGVEQIPRADADGNLPFIENDGQMYRNQEWKQQEAMA